ncbi:MAG: cobalt-precorrin-5B (C(1))-methyltransferase CbiD [Candidatus Methanoplasma sp.]|jgi:cobalt-precorrin-5B (C1)-methyltransferase|nr:cobalt-precorrin-5B (C(1))-methyltransferase CbiD [Candidatus Methanoplasma sp.]
MREEMYVTVDGKRLRCGYTTGTCAAAAARAAAGLLLSGEEPRSVRMAVPAGNVLEIPVEDLRLEGGSASCSVRKDGGDDADATHGLMVEARVSLRPDGAISVDGGEGVGRVTKGGLDQPVGSAAINSTPRRMIAEALEDARRAAGSASGLEAVISVPGGAEASKRTFNSRLGIVGGISILGTSGIVEPMSDAGLIGAIRAEMGVRLAEGRRILLLVPGNMGRDFSRGMGGDSEAVKCSNFIGEAIDCAAEKGAEGILVVGNLGKMVKVAGGVMNTHSRQGDCRMEIMCAAALEAGASAEEARRVLGCASTDDALDAMGPDLARRASGILMDKIAFHLRSRAGGMRAEAVVFSSKYGELGETGGARGMIAEIERQARK